MAYATILNGRKIRKHMIKRRRLRAQAVYGALLFSMAMGVSGCNRYYSYRTEEDSNWTDLLYYEISVNVSLNQDELKISVHRQKHDGITHLDSTVIVTPYFHPQEELMLEEIDEYGARYYRLEGVDTWRTDMPLHINARYQVDSMGVVLTRKYKIVLEKHGRWGSFSFPH